MSRNGRISVAGPGRSATPMTDYGGLRQALGGYRRASPEDLDSLRALVLEANRERTPIRVRGNGHSMNGASVPRDGERLVVTGSLCGFRFDRRGTVTAGAGAAIWDVDQVLRRYGYRLPVVNDGGKPASTVGGYLSAGGFGAASGIEGGFWETVAAVTLVTGDGRVLDIGPGDPLFPWLFGSMGQLGVIHEATLRIVPLEGVRAPYPQGESGRVEASAQEWERIAWFTLLAPARLQRPLLDLLAELERRHVDVWRRRPPYRYDIAFKTFTPPLLHPFQGPLVAVGIWGTPAAEGFDPGMMAAIELDIIVLTRGLPYVRRYLQTEMTFHPDALCINVGMAVYSEFREWKRRLDPNHLLTPGILAAETAA